MTIEQKYLPPEILNKSTISGKEYGWDRQDFQNVIEAATEIGLGIIGGQVQFKLPDGTCELYWRKYDTAERVKDEKWTEYRERTKQECLSLFNQLPINKELVNEGIENFDFLKDKFSEGINLEKYLIFIIYFNDKETENE